MTKRTFEKLILRKKLINEHSWATSGEKSFLFGEERVMHLLHKLHNFDEHLTNWLIHF